MGDAILMRDTLTTPRGKEHLYLWRQIDDEKNENEAALLSFP